MSIFFESALNTAKNGAGLAIKAGGSEVAKYGNSVNYIINGKMYMHTTEDIDLTGVDLLEGEHVMVSVWLDEAKTVSITLGTVSLGYVDSVLTPYETKDVDMSLERTHALIGTIYILALSDDFVGWTTALDAATALVIYNDVFSSLGV